MDLDRGWRFVSIGVEGQPTDIAGVNPWAAEWTATGSRITVAHPQYPRERHVMRVYEVKGSAPPVRFAAGEFSNGVWGFSSRPSRMKPDRLCAPVDAVEGPAEVVKEPVANVPVTGPAVLRPCPARTAADQLELP